MDFLVRLWVVSYFGSKHFWKIIVRFMVFFMAHYGSFYISFLWFIGVERGVGAYVDKVKCDQSKMVLIFN